MRRVEVVETKETYVCDVTMDVDMDVPQDTDIANVLTFLMPQAAGQATLKKGNYNIRLLAVVTEVGEEEETK